MKRGKNSTYFIDENRVPKSDAYNNLRNKTMKQIIEENNIQKNGIRFQNGYLDFEPISKRTVQVVYEPYLDDILAGNRETFTRSGLCRICKTNWKKYRRCKSIQRRRYRRKQVGTKMEVFRIRSLETLL